MADWGALAQAILGNWSLYDKSGAVAVPFDTFFSADVSAEAKVTQYPTEPNGFMDYNKVQSPGEVSIVLGLTGFPISRAAVVERLEKLRESTELLSVVTPEKTFTDYTLEAFSYKREAKDGADRIKVELRLKEVRQVEAEYSNETLPEPKQAGDGATKSAGKQAADKASPQAQQAAAAKSEARAPEGGKKQSLLSFLAG